jgi:hypothetical protein
MTVLTLSQLATMVVNKSWDLLTPSQRTDFRDTVAPKLEGFDGQQRAWFRDWWFACTQAQVDTMNAALPASVRVSPVSHLGQLYLNIDLATDCMQAGDTYAAARPVLRTLICTNIPNLPDLLPKPGI